MGLFSAMRAQGLSLAKEIERSNELPNHYQDLLSEVLRRIQPSVIIETGVATGISTDRILDALDHNGHGVLHSIDPGPCAGLFEIAHPRWVKHLALSQDVLSEIYRQTGPWDMFLHDSDHGVWCQTYEYEVAWHFVKDGGYILSDDITWGSPPHMAWAAFCAKRQVTPEKIGNCGVVQKPLLPGGEPLLSEVEIDHITRCAKDVATAAYLAYCKIPGATDQMRGGIGNGASRTYAGAVQP